MALSKGSRLGLIVIVISVLGQTVNPQTPDQRSPGDRWHQVSRSSRTQSREPRQYYTSQKTVSPGTSSADVEYFPGTYRRTTTTHNYGGRRPVITEQTYTHRQSGPIKTTIEHSYSNRRVSTSYGNIDSRWRDFVDAAIEGRNYVGSRESCAENEPCYPPMGDLMIGREKMLVASSTCGDGMIYCDHDITNTTRADGPGVCRQTCSSNPRSPNYFGVENIIKQNTAQQMNKRWQSAPGQEEVTIQLNLEAEFQFTHLIMTFHTFRPKVMIIEKSIDGGATFKEIAYFAYDCSQVFPSIPRGPKRKLTDVVCEEKYSQLIPKHNGKLLFSNLVPRDEALKMSNLRELDEIIRVTNLRFKFLKLHKLGDDAIGDSEALQQKYYYSIRSLIIRGTCSCYGHAMNCLPASNDTMVENKVYSKCQCGHNTIGDHCKECKPLYRDLKWQRASKEFSSCKSCDCNELADECVFDEQRFVATGKKSGGRCINCRDHTAGDNCELCEEFYYRNPRGSLYEKVCRRCECDQNGSRNGGRCIQYDDGTQRAGQCVCKGNVHGPRCDQCKPGFWNLNASNDDGCEACQCDRRGIRMGSQGCDQVTGKCACKENVVGQSCDQCAPGHYGLEEGPTGCKPCDCDRGGAHNPDTCDLITGNCECKDGIEGRRCDQVKDGYFVALPDYLIHEAEIPVQRRDAKVIVRPHNAQSNMRDFTGVGYMDLGMAGMIEVNFPVIPWTGDYNILVRGDPRSHNQELEITLIRDVRLQSDGVCKRNGAQDEPRDMINLRTLDAAPVMSVCLEKDSGVTIRLESTATSEAQILVDSVVLVPSYEKLDVYPRNIPLDHVNYCVNHVERYGITNINEVCPKLLFSGGLAIWNRAFKCDCGAGTSSNVCDRIGGQCKCKMNVVGRQCDACDTTSYGLDIEAECKACNCNTEGSRNQFCDPRGKCNCIDGVFGDKCDRCKPGFWGTPRNCRPCECNNRAETCEPKTGVCIDCRDNTAGDHCDKCLEGYYGDPLRGIPCNSCMCPGSAASGRNHATSCTLSSTNEMYCHCKPGYKTPKCEECDNNYFQDKHGCIPCECNGKIDLSLEGNCDPLTGKCLRCLHNSEGDQCELCKPGHWKNAKNDCQECDCDSTGSVDSYCNQDDGKCTCHPNVVGDRCSACAEGFYDFHSGKGCKACNCDVHGTVDAGVTCGHDGQCYCKPGRGGLRCNECSPGFYGDPASGCYRCDCDGYQGAIKGVCDARTGHCKCREGMAGPRCDQCARGFKGKAPLCEPCDPCFADWDKVIQDLDLRTQNLTETARLIKQTGTSGIHREFKEIEGYLSQIKEILAKANIPGLDLSQRQNLLDQLKRMLETIEGKLAAAENKHQAILAESIGLVSSAAKLDDDVQDLDGKVKKLEEDMTSLREQDVMGAFKLIQDNVKKAKEYQQESYIARGVLDNSTALRNEASRLLDRQQSAFRNVYNRNEDLMKELDGDIQNLERTIPEINRHLCDSETSVEGCKDKCGGVGCDECGENIGCGRAAVYQAKNALEMAKDLETILQAKQSKAASMRDNVEEARSSANQANNKAIEAHSSVIDAHNTASNSLDDLKKLLEEIETLLRKAVGTPGDIRRIAKDCLELKVELTPKEIEELSRTIEMTIQSLSNVGNILSETQEDKDRTIDLRNKANRIKDEAQKILNHAEAVRQHLEEAARDQADTRTINEQILRELQNSNSEIADLQDRGTAVKQRSTELFTKSSNLRETLQALHRNKTQAVQQANKLQVAFDEAHREAEGVHKLSEELNQKYQEAVNEISRKTSSGDAKKKEVDELRRRTNDLYKDYNQIAADLQVIEDFYNEYEQKMDDQNEQIKQMMAEMERYQAEIDKKAVDYQTCVPK